MPTGGFAMIDTETWLDLATKQEIGTIEEFLKLVTETFPSWEYPGKISLTKRSTVME